MNKAQRELELAQAQNNEPEMAKIERKIAKYEARKTDLSRLARDVQVDRPAESNIKAAFEKLLEQSEPSIIRQRAPSTDTLFSEI
jgi:hypothetical protein